MSNQCPTANGQDQGPDEPRQKPDTQDQQKRDEQNPNKGHGPLKGTDTPATTDAEYAEREKGKRTTM